MSSALLLLLLLLLLLPLLLLLLLLLYYYYYYYCNYDCNYAASVTATGTLLLLRLRLQLYSYPTPTPAPTPTAAATAGPSSVTTTKTTTTTHLSFVILLEQHDDNHAHSASFLVVAEDWPSCHAQCYYDYSSLISTAHGTLLVCSSAMTSASVEGSSIRLRVFGLNGLGLECLAAVFLLWTCYRYAS